MFDLFDFIFCPQHGILIQCWWAIPTLYSFVCVHAATAMERINNFYTLYANQLVAWIGSKG